MTADFTALDAMRSFFESPEGRHLFGRCPMLPYLAHLSELGEATANNIHAHMLGHILDYKAGQVTADQTAGNRPRISQDEIDGELRYIYNDCNNATLNQARKLDPNRQPQDDPAFQGFGPEQRGCHGADAKGELMAEAIRAYLQAPSYMKTVAPNVARRIRSAVNPNPDVNLIIQFN